MPVHYAVVPDFYSIAMLMLVSVVVPIWNWQLSDAKGLKDFIEEGDLLSENLDEASAREVPDTKTVAARRTLAAGYYTRVVRTNAAKVEWMRRLLVWSTEILVVTTLAWIVIAWLNW